jgi:DNA-3-methyladenine glycosylase II
MAKTATPANDWADAQKHLAAASPKMRALISRLGPCTLKPERNHFAALCGSIMSQQILVKAAEAIYGRFVRLFPRKTPKPAELLKLSDEQIRSAGVGPQKIRYLRDIAAGFLDGRVPVKHLARLGDEELIEHLTQLKGVGRWTAEMYLMFVLCRPDVWPVDDVGLHIGAQQVFGLKKRPTPKSLVKLGTPFAPYRTVAAWYLWKSRDGAAELPQGK